MTTAFVLGGGGVLGAAEVGMLRALFEVDVTPDLVLGTSVGALNGAMVARDPTPAVIERLTDLWQDASTVARRSPTGPCGPYVVRSRPGPTCTPRRSCRRGWWRSSARRPSRSCRCGSRCARPASSARPSTGSPPAASSTRSWRAPPYPVCSRRPRSDGEHFLDGGIVNSIPLGRAIALGADRVFVLQVGRIDRPLKPPQPSVGGRPGLLRDRPPPPVRARAGRGAP